MATNSGALVQQRKNIAQGQKGQNAAPSSSAIKPTNMNKGGSAKKGGKNC